MHTIILEAGYFDEPKVYFMHIGGMGDAGALAAGVKKVYDKIAEIHAASPTPAKSFGAGIGTTNAITATPLEAIGRCQSGHV
jgi:hypothetical protein